MKNDNTSAICIKKIVLLVLCVGINVLGRALAVRFSLPGWLDSFGTFIAAYSMGSIPGAIIGVTSNIIASVEFGTSLWFCIVSVIIAIIVGVLSKKGYFETVFHTMTVAGAVTVCVVIIASVLDIALFDNSTGNLWGDGVRDFLCEMGLAKFPAMLIGELYLGNTFAFPQFLYFVSECLLTQHGPSRITYYYICVILS